MALLTPGPVIRTLQVGKIPEAQCISHCSCFNSTISPVCGSNSITYLSACFAGCASRKAQEPTGRSGSSITQVGAAAAGPLSRSFPLSAPADFFLLLSPKSSS